MAEEPRTHYLVEFASRYAGSRFKTLTAGAALWRAEALTYDAEALLELRKSAESKEIRFGDRGGTYEIISYYVVGLVTCLEWHARSRLVDLLLFRPNSIEPTDVKNIATLAISQMVAEGITVPHLLGAATNVSQFGEYLRIFRRVFNALNIRTDIESELRNTKTGVDLHRTDIDTNLFIITNHLFEIRNHLVHEIDLGVIGHFSIRDMWSVEEAIEFGKAVIACIKLIEAQITKDAPIDFPNRLKEDGSEEDEFEKLKEKVAALEVELADKVEAIKDGDAYWNEAVMASRTTQAKEFAYIDQSTVLRPIRHIDKRQTFKIELLKTRLAFLLLLKTEMDNF